MSFVMVTLLVLAAQPGDSGAKVLRLNPYYLRADERLQVSLNLEPDHPRLADILAQLRHATRLVISVDDSLQHHDPDFGHIQPSPNGYHAWQIMEIVAKKDLHEGYWKKTAEGYRLVGTSVVPDTPRQPKQDATWSLLLWYFLGLAPLALLLLVLGLRKRAVRARQPYSTAQSGPLMPPTSSTVSSHQSPT